ncbi:hypothetical protein WME76_42925 [Sorangium sp. So ce119]|uniref:hypothetical protein n=1 Tax=Sorangium sp. So ce119 TaxID=3133279 RepID=UPI000779B33C|nr:hypothetical protein BE11_50805 [Sorangium cellulosum]
MEPIIDLAPGAEENPLAAQFGGLIREHLAGDARRASDFRALRGSVLVVAQDSGTSMTMRFDHGRLTIHDGAIGIPSVTFCGDEAALRRLPDIAFHRWVSLPKLGVLHRRQSEPLRELARLVASGELKIYGLVAHPRLILALLRVLSRHP